MLFTTVHCKIACLPVPFMKTCNIKGSWANTVGLGILVWEAELFVCLIALFSICWYWRRKQAAPVGHSFLACNIRKHLVLQMPMNWSNLTLSTGPGSWLLTFTMSSLRLSVYLEKSKNNSFLSHHLSSSQPLAESFCQPIMSHPLLSISKFILENFEPLSVQVPEFIRGVWTVSTQDSSCICILNFKMMVLSVDLGLLRTRKPRTLGKISSQM